MDAILDILMKYYGLDWLAMGIGLFGTFLITKQQRMGFILNSIGCILGVIVAGMSDQAGYVVYNTIILFMLSRAFMNWPKLSAEKSLAI